MTVMKDTKLKCVAQIKLFSLLQVLLEFLHAFIRSLVHMHLEVAPETFTLFIKLVQLKTKDQRYKAKKHKKI